MFMNTEMLFVTESLRVPRQIGANRKNNDDDDDDDNSQSVEELCLDRPPDEYFRLTVEGDCRDVVR
jgi:hypothetical protein